MSWFKAGKDMTINGRVVTKSGGGYTTAYGVQEVSVGQHEWKIKAHNCGSGGNYLIIAISADTSHADANLASSTTTEHYLLFSNGDLYSKNNQGIAYANGGGIFTTGDTITVHLDLDKQQMSFSKNGNNIGIAFNNIVKTQKYRLAVQAHYASTKFELISYTNLSKESNKNEENKNEEEKMKQESKNIVLSETDEKTIELITKEMKEMRNEIGSLKDEIGSLKDEIKSLKEIILSNNKKVNDNNYYSNDDTKDVCVFLQDTVQLPQYIHAFIDAGFTNLASFGSVTADDLKEMGCKLAHRHRILKAISKTWHK